MKKVFPDKKSLIVLISAISVLSAALSFFFGCYLKSYPVATAVAIMTTVFSFVYLPLFFRRLSFRFSETELHISSGVFIHSEVSVKLSSVQYYSYIRIPAADRIGFNFIFFYVPGGRILLPFLKYHDAKEFLCSANTLSES
ncbi:MAG: PH domain-containing protein [Ruminococcus sp.]|nr:PH domain-containing protein [Oscillospiraceae bacterium]